MFWAFMMNLYLNFLSDTEDFVQVTLDMQKVFYRKNNSGNCLVHTFSTFCKLVVDMVTMFALLGPVV